MTTRVRDAVRSLSRAVHVHKDVAQLAHTHCQTPAQNSSSTASDDGTKHLNRGVPRPVARPMNTVGAATSTAGCINVHKLMYVHNSAL